MQVKKWFLGIHEAVVVKRQSTVETSDFGAECVAMKQDIDALRGLRYKLKIMGMPISGLVEIVHQCAHLPCGTESPGQAATHHSTNQ